MMMLAMLQMRKTYTASATGLQEEDDKDDDDDDDGDDDNQCLHCIIIIGINE